MSSQKTVKKTKGWNIDDDPHWEKDTRKDIKLCTKSWKAKMDKRKESEWCVGIKIGYKNGKKPTSQIKLKLGTWNIKMLAGNEVELVEGR